MFPHQQFPIGGHHLAQRTQRPGNCRSRARNVLIRPSLLALLSAVVFVPGLSAQTPPLADADQDGVNDYRELRDGSDLNDPNSFRPLSKGLVAHYPFEGNANDESGYGWHGTSYGARLVANRYGEANKAYRFPGNAWIETAQKRLLDGAEEATISAWVRIDPLMGNNGGWGGQLLAVGDSRGGMDPISFRFTPTGTSQVNFQDTQLANTGPAGIGGRNGPHLLNDLSAGWHHLAVVLAKDVPQSSFRIFVDGYEQLRLVGSDDGVSAFRKISYDIDMPLLIGALEGRPFYRTPGQFWIGDLDDIRVYNRALGAAEIAQLFHADDVQRDSDGDGLSDAWERGSGRYRLVAGRFTWHEARADAEKKGGRLASITSEEEWKMIKRELGEGFAVGKECWIGATDEAVEGTWTWVSGEKFAFSKWHAGEPSGGRDTGEDYATIFGDSRRGHTGQPAQAGESWNDDFGVGVMTHYLLEFGYPTDPLKADTDGDGHNDRVETLAGTDPNDPSSQPATDTKRPVLTVNRVPAHTNAQTLVAKGSVTDNVSPVAILYRVEAPGNASSWTEQKLPAGEERRKSWKIEVPLVKQGLWKLRLRAVDAVGNRSNIKTVTVVVDRRQPTVDFLSKPVAPRRFYELKTLLEDNVGVSAMDYQTKAPSGKFSPWSERIRFDEGQLDRDRIWRKTFDLARRGEWQFKIRVFDAAANVSAVTLFKVQR